MSALVAGTAAVIDETTPGYPVTSLRELPAGDYFVQALANVYTEFHRSDGHTIWAHMDQWEGQHFTRAPGNLVSAVQRLHLDPATGYDVHLGSIGFCRLSRCPPTRSGSNTSRSRATS